jgi:hypothetical protein
MSGGDCLNCSRIKELIPPGAHWLMLAITALLFPLVVVFVDLKPVVEEIFSSRPAIRGSRSRGKSSAASHRSRNSCWRYPRLTFLHRAISSGLES